MQLFALQFLLFSSFILPLQAEPFAQPQPSGVTGSPLAGKYSDSYFADEYGNILMIVNVLGEVGTPGQIIVSENADFPVILSRAGGLKPSANLRKVVLSRFRPDGDGKQAYKLNLDSYYQEGDRSSFLAIKPNDTIIIPARGVDVVSLVTLVGSLSLSLYSTYTLYNLIFK
ncbi:MAG: polysaccharide biosynthesis/export family protein [Chlorobium sp.]